MAGRRIQIDYDGEILDMDWDRPEPPTKRDVRDWMQRRRSIKPNTPPPGPAPEPNYPDPDTKTPKDTGFLGAIGEGLGGLAQFGKNMIVGHPLNPLAGPRMRAQQEVAQGIAEPFMRGGREAYEYEKKGDYLKSAGRTLATIPEAALGIPVTDIARDIGQGRYGHAAGSGAFAGALAYAGTKGARRTPAQALPDVPPVAKPPAQPRQMPLIEGFEQAGLPFRETVPEIAPVHGPEIGPYGVPDPNIQPPLGELQPVIGQQKLGMTSKPTRAWTPGPPVGEMPKPRAAAGPVEKAATSNIPELQDAAKKTSLFQRARDKVKGASGAQAAAEFGKGNISVVRDAGKTGPKLAQLLSRTRLLGEYLGGDWTVRAKEATKGLTPEQIKVYVESRDKGIVPNDPAVQQALEKRAALDAEVVKATKDSGAGYRTAEGTVIPFRERVNYWPHIYDRKNIVANKQSYIDNLISEGWSPEDAQKSVENASRYGERLISAQHERQGNAPGYRVDLDADYMHLNDLGKRVAEARELGPRDLADPQSPVTQLIKGTDNPQRITEIVSEHLGRNAPESGTASWGAVNQRARQIVSAAHLSHFALSNMSQLATVPLRSNLGAYAGALKKVVTNWKKTVGEAEGTGALQTIHQDLLREVGGESIVSKVYGMKKSETLNRTVSSVAGKATAESLFAQLKKDPTNKRARARLENLVLEPIDKVLKQDALSPEQTGIAGGRMAEITQGRAQSIDLPKVWSGHPLMEIPLIFKKYAFTQTRIIRDAIAENPGRNIPLAIALYGAMGEVIGDVKAGVRGTVSGQGPGQAIAERGEGIDRIAADLGQAWALGILTDLLETSNKPQGLAEYALGPVFSDVGKASANIRDLTEGKPKGITKQAVGAVPFIGTGLAAKVGGGKGGGSGRLPRLPRPKDLPSLPRP